MTIKTRLLRAALGMAALTILVSGAAQAQRAMLVLGGGYARECYEAVRDKVAEAKAIETCDIALQQETMKPKTRAATYNNRGIAHMRAEHNELAERDYRAALRIMPNLPEVKINLGAIYYNLGQYSESLAALDEGVKAEDADARAVAYYNRGLTHEKLGRFERAYEDYSTALKLAPEFEQATRQLRRFSVVRAGES